MRRPGTRTAAHIVLVAIMLVGVACSHDAASPIAPASAVAQTPVRDLRVSAVEFEFNQTHWTIPAGETITVDFANRGTIPHEWSVLKRGVHIDTQGELRDEMVHFEIEALAEGETTSQGFTVKEPGTYQFLCALEGHFDAGMEGTLTVAT
jgi:uncharacterized cupredoxin-like copper-binding protein